ncbi:MAG TPA: Asd/ArgC dimerization domain-containing protein [Terriglobia bacterium]|nr:Asd/ArgC dimerization domain-containing protein [Terriglobia bacterium]
MNAQRLRKSPNVAIVGSTSLLGKELQDVLETRGLPVGRLTLLETEEYAGLLQEFAGDIQITQVISPKAFNDIDIAFFACSPQIMNSYITSGAKFPDLTIDLTQAGLSGSVYLHGISDPLVLRPSGYFVNPHPAAIVIGRILSTLHNAFAVQSAAVTLLEPASERGNAGVDELQEQTVSLLNFQQVEKKTFAGQLAFNILPEEEASARTEARILEQLDQVLGRTVPKPTIMAMQAPVFHSHVYALAANLLGTPSAEELVKQLERGANVATSKGAGEPSPVTAIGSDKIHLGRVRFTESGLYALSAVADNLRIAASNAVQMAEHIMLAPALDA